MSEKFTPGGGGEKPKKEKKKSKKEEKEWDTGKSPDQIVLDFGNHFRGIDFYRSTFGDKAFTVLKEKVSTVEGYEKMKFPLMDKKIFNDPVCDELNTIAKELNNLLVVMDQKEEKEFFQDLDKLRKKFEDIHERQIGKEQRAKKKEQAGSSKEIFKNLYDRLVTINSYRTYGEETAFGLLKGGAVIRFDEIKFSPLHEKNSPDEADRKVLNSLGEEFNNLFLEMKTMNAKGFFQKYDSLMKRFEAVKNNFLGKK